VATDLAGGLGDDREYVFATQPDDPEMRESVNAWIWDDGVEVGMPRMGIEAVADQWETHDLQVNIAYADGRVFNIFESGKVHDPLSSDGRPRVLGAGPLAFELVEPFRHWRLHLEGLAVERTVQEQMAGNRPDREPSVPVQFELDIRSAVPPWENGALLPEAAKVLAEQEEGALMGGPRFEQLSRATGTLQVGDELHEIRGGALRVRRQGIRRLPTFRGHAWQSALFPSGRGFGYIVYPPRDDGKPTYNEGYLFNGDGRLTPARVVQAPWLRTMQPSGQDVSVVLETESGETAIHGESIISTFSAISGLGMSGSFPILQQAITRFSWDGEVANGMMERSTMPDQMDRP
jgi:prepilin-type processing-associated H-X9-DG protein